MGTLMKDVNFDGSVWMPNEYHYATYAIEKPSE